MVGQSNIGTWVKIASAPTGKQVDGPGIALEDFRSRNPGEERPGRNAPADEVYFKPMMSDAVSELEGRPGFM